jgi:hypothetical protein
MSAERDDLVSKLIDIREQEKTLRKQLDDLDQEDRFAKAKKYEGRYFIENNERTPEYIRCVFVHNTNTESCNPMCILVSYWVPNTDEYFEIESYHHFYPEKWEEEEKWDEIGAEEFLDHYNEVQRRIEFAVSRKK